ncbi:MAG: phosphatidate phosphatase App1 family protein [Aureliella sp.]
MVHTESAVSNLKPKHQAVLFPSLAYYDPKRDSCQALVHGRVFIESQIPLGTRLLLRGLKRAMKATPEQVASETFQRRIVGFLAAPGKRRKIALQIASHDYNLRRRSRRNGAFYGRLGLPADFGKELLDSNTPQQVPMQLLRDKEPVGTSVPTNGKIHFVPPYGLSVISDIDDTIKLTDATSKKEMLANTFLRPFEVIEGMAELYRSWQQKGCVFHYVSSSPWQLYLPLSEFCSSTNFPDGSMHLRYFRVRDQMFKRFRLLRRNSKVAIIAGIFKRLPHRKFILVGDSGEKDPEIYRFLARRFPGSVSAILIRELKQRPFDRKRLTRLESLQGEYVDLVRVFQHPSEITSVADDCFRYMQPSQTFS